jgi:pimeloyl-ACP methyl ester carboxylesterase
MDATVAEQLGVAARVRDAGPDAPALLLVHGLGGDSTFWAEAFACPELERTTLVAVDLPGFGTAAPLRPFTFDAVVRLLVGLVEGLPVPVAAVGHSLGGTVTALLAQRASLRGIVLIEANLLPLGPEVSASAAGAHARAEGCFDEWFDGFAASVLEHASDDRGSALYVGSFARADREAFGEACEELVAATAGGVGQRYAELDVPRAYVVGSDEEPAHVTFLEANKLELVRIADAGHSVMVDQPEVFYGFLAGWLAAAFSR